MKVYKLLGEAYEISEERIVYSSYEMAYDAIKEWETFLGMDTKEAIETEQISIVEFELKGL